MARTISHLIMGERIMKTRELSLTVALLLVLCSGSAHSADQRRSALKPVQKAGDGGPFNTLVNINNVSMWISYDGASARNPSTGNAGVTYPRGSATSIYADGLMWGGLVHDGGSQILRVNGGTYQQGIVGGQILSKGVAEDVGGSSVRIFRVRRDYATADLTQDAAELGVDVATVRDQYKTDWLEWPWQKGAPYYDRNGNGVYDPDPSGAYDPAKDEPGYADADQVVWFVTNDLNEAQSRSFEGSDPIGLEIQTTLWGYARADQLGNVIFKQFKFIYKGTATGSSVSRIDSMYVGQWADPDLGDYSDDFEGCDTVYDGGGIHTSSLGFVYNSTTADRNYNAFGLAPPAMGYDFFAGPLVPSPGSTAVFDLKYRPGYRNLPMSSWIYFAAGGTYTDPDFDYVGAGQWYNLLRGLTPVTGAPFVFPGTTEPTKFWLSGDPVAHTGNLDGTIDNPGDRRMMLSAGPFTMSLGDTQEVVVALVGGIGSDRLSSISVMRFNDQSAQFAYDNLFELPKAPPPPKLRIAQLDKELVLDWGFDSAAVAATENDNNKGYAFEGYNVYQLPSATASADQGVRLATFDLKTDPSVIQQNVVDPTSGQVVSKAVELGTNSGIKRLLLVKEDKLRGKPLVDGQSFYFAVTAYNYNPDPGASLKSIEDPAQPLIVKAVPQSTNPGVRYGAQYGAAITAVSHTSLSGGLSDGNVEVTVTDPSKLTGHQYKVTFDSLGTDVVWNLDDISLNPPVRKLSNQLDQTGDDNYMTVDGMLVKVIGAPNDFKRFSEVANAAGPIPAGTDVGFDITPKPDFGAYSADWYRDVDLGNGSVLDLPDGMQVAGGYLFIVAGSNTVADYTTAVGRWTRDGALFSKLVPNDYEIRFTARGGKAIWPSEFHANVTPGVYNVPFEIWYTGIGTPNDTTDDVRMIPAIFDVNDVPGAPTWGFQLDHEASGGNNDPYSDWIYWYMPADKTPGESGYNAAMAANPTTRSAAWTEHLARMVIMNWNEYQDNGNINALPETGTVFRIEMTKPNRVRADVFTFTAPAVKSSRELAKTDIGKINVFPNPYYGYNRVESSRFNRFVTFNHLPPNDWRIRIISLDGAVVKYIDPNSPSQHPSGPVPQPGPGMQFATWDLTNQTGLPVASGIYVAYIEMPQLGVTKTLKLVVIQEAQVLDYY